MIGSSDEFLRRAVKGQERLPNVPELSQPEDIIVLAATALNQLHPEIDKMAVMMAVHDMFRLAVNNEIENRQRRFAEYMQSRGLELVAR